MSILRDRIQTIITEHGGIRQAARFLKIDAAYLLRLHDGEKTNPGEPLLKKLGLKRVISYEPIVKDGAIE